MPISARALRRGHGFDQLLIGFFGTDDLSSLPPQRVAIGVEKLRVQFGLERDGGWRFAL